MCNVCCALNALEAPTTFRWPNKPRIGLEVEAHGEGAELAPARYRFRRVHDADLAPRREPRKAKAYEEPWSVWLETSDLADVMGWLGVDREWTYGDSAVQAYILREAPIQWVEAMLASAERVAAERR